MSVGCSLHTPTTSKITMPFFHILTNWLPNSKSQKSTMKTKDFEVTHTVDWRYKTLKPITKALVQDFHFKGTEVKLRVRSDTCIAQRYLAKCCNFASTEFTDGRRR